VTTNPKLSAEAVAAIKGAVRLGLDSLRAEIPQSLSEWAAANFILAGESSHQKGGWEAWPCQIGILDFMSDDRIEELAVMKSKRVGYTKMITAFIAYNIAHRRRKQALWQPTDDDRDSYVKSEIDPILDPDSGVQAVNSARRKGRGSEDTIKFKQFRDSVLHLLGGKAARAYRRITVAVAVLDEWSGFDQQIEKSGDPGGLVKGRLEGAPYPKFVGGSTPRVKGLCHVERACENTEALVRFNIECPRCGLDHPLLWGGKAAAHGFKWERGNPASVRHVCPHCHESITQADYMPGGRPLQGAWVCVRTGRSYGMDRVWRDSMGMPCRPPRTLGVQLWAAYSPQRTWESIVKEFEEAHAALEKGDVGPMQLFVNETLGETWEIKGEAADDHVLQKRAEPFALATVPVGGLVLTAGVDVQRNRWEIAVWAWGRGLESWTVDHRIIEGNPASEADWEQVTEYLQRRYQQAHAVGGSLGLSAISVDSSDQTQAVYNWVRTAQARLPGLRAVKGDNSDNRHILGGSSLQEINWRGQKWPRGIKLWLVGVDSAKDYLLGQLDIGSPGPGYLHFSADLPREWFEQLTAEQRILIRKHGTEAYRWVKRRPRNEVLDCRNYALHAAMALGLHKYDDQRWSRLEAAIQPAPDLFSMVNRPAPSIEAVHPSERVFTPQRATAAAAAQPAPAATPFLSSFAKPEWSSRL
jgi:terminase, large subunit